MHDFVLVYAKNKLIWRPNLFERSEELNSKYTNPDNDSRGVWYSTNLSVKTYSEKNDYVIVSPNGQKFNPPPSRCWVVSEDKYKEMFAENRIWFGKDGNSRPYQKKFLTEVQQGVVPTTFWSHTEAGHNIGAKSQIRDLFPETTDLFDTPKPTKLIGRIIDLVCTSDDDLVVDFFAGSGTTGHAVFENNIERNKYRKFMLVQVPEIVGTNQKDEKFISDITIDRVKRAGGKIREEYSQSSTDTGFRVFKLAKSNFPENLFSPDPSKSEEENLKALGLHLAEAAQMRLFGEDEFSNLVTEISLKNGFGLFYELTPVGGLSKNKVYRLVGNDKSTLLCLDNYLHDETVEGLKPLKDEQLIVSKFSLDTTKKFSLQTEFKDNLWVV